MTEAEKPVTDSPAAEQKAESVEKAQDAAQVQIMTSLVGFVIITSLFYVMYRWVYYTSMVVLLGAEFTRLWAQRYGRGITPEKGAVAYVEEERRVRAS